MFHEKYRYVKNQLNPTKKKNMKKPKKETKPKYNEGREN